MHRIASAKGFSSFPYLYGGPGGREGLRGDLHTNSLDARRLRLSPQQVRRHSPRNNISSAVRCEGRRPKRCSTAAPWRRDQPERGLQHRMEGRAGSRLSLEDVLPSQAALTAQIPRQAANDPRSGRLHSWSKHTVGNPSTRWVWLRSSGGFSATVIGRSPNWCTRSAGMRWVMLGGSAMSAPRPRAVRKRIVAVMSTLTRLPNFGDA